MVTITILLLKSAIVGIFALAALFLFSTAYLGRASAKSSQAYEDWWYYSEKHKRFATRTIWTILFAFVLTGTMVWLQGGSRPLQDLRHGELFFTHLCFFITFLLTILTLRFWKTGIQAPLIHKPLAYLSLVLFVGTIGTGSILIFSDSPDKKIEPFSTKNIRVSA